MDHHPPQPDRHHDPIDAVHRLRDREESERQRQLGGLLVHDLNNVLFALLGRVQLLQRRAPDAATARAADEILGTARLLESQVVKLHAACRRDEPATASALVASAVSEALRESIDALPAHAKPREFAQLLGLIPADATFEGDPTQVATAVRQVLSIHRARATAPIALGIRVRAGSPESIEITFEDSAGAPTHVPQMPSLLDGSDAKTTFELAGLPLAAAHRAIRDFGGRVSMGATHAGLRSAISFEFRRGVAIARFDAAGREHEHGNEHGDGCGHEDECLPASRRVLIADDDAAVRAVLVAALESIGDDVDTLDNPGACDTHKDLASFDVIVLDAGGGGVEALRRLRARGVEVPVLLASGGDVVAPEDPFTRTALKPFALDALDRTLGSLASMRKV